MEPSGANWKEPPLPLGRSSEVQAVAASRKAVSRMTFLEKTWKLPGWVSTHWENFTSLPGKKKIYWIGLEQQFVFPFPLLDQIIFYKVIVISLQPSLSL